MNENEFKLPFILPQTEDVIRRLNYNPKKTILDENLFDLIKTQLEAAKDFIHPVALVNDINIIEVSEKRILLDDGKEIISQKLAAVLKKSRFVSIIAATIGEEIRKKMESANLTEAVIIDAIGSEAIEAFVDYIVEKVLVRERRLFGFRPTMRYSPGYGDLSVETNSYILEKVGAKKIGIGFHPESFMLLPEKSITAIIGWEK
ncbi:MAG: hypothetical protein ACP5QT_06985 [Brevinematia bacterium]